ncbi:interleukin 15, like [Genypterus blacodes]|uniref:interleukin 15, like n=1 Tax=Genypterus blacodes TaxID=154954 RepID=UPI003F769465
MLRGRPALANVYLCLIFLPVLTLQVLRCSHDSLSQVNGLSDKVKDLEGLECRLYTPTKEDYQICPSSTLSCFAAETDVLIKEWGTVISLPKLKVASSLRTLASRFNQTAELDCRQCELHKEEEADTFLGSLRSVLEMMNVNCSSFS